MIVVSDTTAISTLLKCGEERLLPRLYGGVLVPEAVGSELLRFHRGLPDFIRIEHADIAQRLPGTEHLGAGEAAALKLAIQLRADLLLTDDKQARRAAAKLDIRFAGLLGVVLDGKRRGYVADVGTFIAILQSKGGLYLSEATVAEALRLAAEP